MFSLVPKEEAAVHRVYGSHFVDLIKNGGKPNAFEKSRLVVQALNDSDHGLLTHVPAVQRSSLCPLLSLCAIDPNLSFFTRDISQAYVQSETAVQRRNYVRSLQFSTFHRVPYFESNFHYTDSPRLAYVDTGHINDVILTLCLLNH